MESDEVVAALRRLDLVGADEAVHLTPLAGGVSSDICLVETASRRFCVKRALARLKVAAAVGGAARAQCGGGGVDQDGRQVAAERRAADSRRG